MPVSGGARVFEAGVWEIDLERRELRMQGVAVPVGGRAFEIIEVLVQSAGELVSKDSLMDRIWPGVVIGENTLQVHISAVRKALGSDRGMLQTVSGRGYRLLGNWIARGDRARVDPIDLAPISIQVPPVQSNLPMASTDLIGRAAVVQRVRDLLSLHRMVTLTGPGGIGKTSLAIEIARTLLPEFGGNVQLVELASISDAALVTAAVANVIGLGANEISPEALARAIDGRRLLLVIDNCEHVINTVASLAEAMLRMCPSASVLATSRELIRIEGEYVHRVTPLDVPAPNPDDPNGVAGHSAVQLFIARASALGTDFASHGENLLTIAAICRRLDGIPLAIEFAAARAAVLGVGPVPDHLDQRFGLLVSGRRTALPRHQTLRATLDWSYDLLSQPERRLLRQLAVFVGGFTLESVAAVARDDSPVDSAPVEDIANLVAKSLVTLDGSGSADRWRLLETIRAYALEKLAASGEADQVARRHAAFFLQLADSEAAVQQIAHSGREIDNIRAALDWAFSPGGDVSTGLALTVAAVPLWIQASLMEECRQRIEQALGRLASPSTRDLRREMQLLSALSAARLVTVGTSPDVEAGWNWYARNRREP